MKTLFLALSGCALALTTATAQTLLPPHTPPTGKYNTTNYPEDRKLIRAMGENTTTSHYCNDDGIAVGPEGKISYGYAEWAAGFSDKGAQFKSITPVPGMDILRIYDGRTAVWNNQLDVVFATPKGDFNIRVQRLETFVKQNGRWCFVAGQGTRIAFKEELEAMSKQ
jgi:hypothetical protein